MPLQNRARRAVLAALVVSAIVVGLTPAPASAGVPPAFPQPLSFSRTPIGGGPGTKVNITGFCSAPTGTASLELITFSDALPGPGATQDFTVNQQDHSFKATLTNPYGQDQGFNGPVTDVRVHVSCASQSAWLPFNASTTPVANTPTVFTVLGDGACGFGFVPAGSDPSIPCPAMVKGFTGSGSIAKTNFVKNGWPRGGSIATYQADNEQRLVVGTGPGIPAGFSISDLVGNTIRGLATYNDFAGGAMVAAGDVTGDGEPDIVIAPSRGGGPHVKVYSDVVFGKDNFYEASGFMAYAPNFTGGVNVAVGDVDGDGVGEIITGAGPGGGPHVRIFDWRGNEKYGFMAYDPNFAGGVTVATGDLAGDTSAEVVTGAGAGGGPHVRVLNQLGHEFAGFMAYWPEMHDGVNVAVGKALGGFTRQVVVGPGAGAEPHVKVLSYKGEQIANPWPGGFFTYTRSFKGGVRVAAAG